ncbi:MAG: 4a-hydroxytetrahydrobiopterin dehydratase [Planctomycetota bacterium]|nr:4a-hydroxytetrahydrobiopterin dehydratase [Planctomycetota bacterium]
MHSLSADQVIDRLVELSEWSLIGDALTRVYSFKDFVAAMGFVQAIAQQAELVSHHPDILIRYNKVTLTLSTHDASGITEKDFSFAAHADRVADALVRS